MNISSLAQAINQAAVHRGSVKESDKAKLIEACAALVGSLKSVDQTLFRLMFAVGIFTTAHFCSSDWHDFRSK
jgi:hypothetical protein